MLLAFKGMQGTAGILAARISGVAAALKGAAAAMGIATGVVAFVGKDVYDTATPEQKAEMAQAFADGDKEKARDIAMDVINRSAALDESDLGRKASDADAGAVAGELTGAAARDSIKLATEIRKATRDQLMALGGAEKQQRLEEIELLSDRMVAKMINAGMAKDTAINVVTTLDGDTIGDATFDRVKEKLEEKMNR